MTTNGRKRYFHIDENTSSEQIYASLDDVESADEDNIDNLMNDSDTEFIAEKEIKQAASSSIEIFSLVTCLEELLELIVEQSNFYAHQNGRNFTVTKEELKAFLGINFVMAINKLPRIAEYWRVDNLIGNDDIQNTMIRNRFCEILQNLHFADNRKDNKTDKAFKMRPVIDHLNSKFSEVLSNDSEQSIDEHMVKFKGRSGMKQYIKSKPTKWGLLVLLLE